MKKDIKILRERVIKGKRQITIEVDLDETGELVIIENNCNYQLGYPLNDDVIHSDQLQEARKVVWCVVQQKWVDA